MFNTKKFVSRNKLSKFLIVGLLTTVLNYLFFVCLLFSGAHYLVAMPLGFLLGTLSGYKLNRAWSFEFEEKNNKVVQYISVYVVSLVLGTFFLSFLVVDLLWNPFIANICVIMLTTVLNFLGVNFWVFRKGVDN
jgi:putative flippase GtrA